MQTDSRTVSEPKNSGRLFAAALTGGAVAIFVETIGFSLLIGFAPLISGYVRFAFLVIILGVILLGGLAGFVAGGVAARIAGGRHFWAPVGAWGIWALACALVLPYFGAEVDWTRLLMMKLPLGLVFALIGHGVIARKVEQGART